MENLFAFFDKISLMLGIRSVYLHLLFKTLLAVLVSYIVWLILLRILAVFEKKVQMADKIRIDGEIFRVIRKATFYGVILVTGTYLVRLFNTGLLEKIFHPCSVRAGLYVTQNTFKGDFLK